MAKWPNHFISGKQFQKRPNWAYLAFKKAKWQPWYKRVCLRERERERERDSVQNFSSQILNADPEQQ